MAFDRTEAGGARQTRKSRAKAPEKVEGYFVAFPHTVADSEAFLGAKPAAQALLLHIARQITGSNNGHLHAARNWLAKRGYKRSSTVTALIDELIERRLIVRTVKGGREGSKWTQHQFAVTWLPITNWTGLQIPQDQFVRGAYLLGPYAPKPKAPRERSAHVLAKQQAREAEGRKGKKLHEHRMSRSEAQTWTPHVQPEAPPWTPHIQDSGTFEPDTWTPPVHNVLMPSAGSKSSAHGPAVINAKPRAAPATHRAWRH